MNDNSDSAKDWLSKFRIFFFLNFTQYLLIWWILGICEYFLACRILLETSPGIIPRISLRIAPTFTLKKYISGIAWEIPQNTYRQIFSDFSVNCCRNPVEISTGISAAITLRISPGIFMRVPPRIASDNVQGILPGNYRS